MSPSSTDFSITFTKNFANLKTAARRLEKLMRLNEFVLDSFHNLFKWIMRANLICIYSIYLSTAGIFDTNQAYAKCAVPFSSYILGWYVEVHLYLYFWQNGHNLMPWLHHTYLPWPPWGMQHKIWKTFYLSNRLLWLRQVQYCQTFVTVVNRF